MRVDARARKLAARLEHGEIAVIDHADMDRATAQALIGAGAVAVLNASPSSSGRYPNLGPALLLEAGIVLVDDCGPDIMTLREGDEVVIVGERVTRSGTTIATGVRQSAAEVQASIENTREGLSTRVAAFAATTGEYFEREAPLLLERVGLPEIETVLEGATVLMVFDDPNSAEELKACREWIRDTNPLVIAVEGGADIAARAHLRPALIVGDMELVSEKLLRSGAELVVSESLDRPNPGKDRLKRMGLEYRVMETSSTAKDAAILLAALAQAQVIVTVGERTSLEDFLDQGRTGMAGTFFTRLLAGTRLVSATAIASTHRPRIRMMSIILLILAAGAALAAAVSVTPLGADVVDSVSDLLGSMTVQSPQSDAITGQ
ncbi:putative cytokinetic ring protein SteA [Schaalia sp. Marseille-Q2122]|uniref:putative cytokinetic ring protein SteA n=1 Tax=Schaalia sp. Marseille-Q2122 TaxID=2736604 RepID=UPI001589D353|nr:putative cytokinetic ring protein SteA [Schaalia sp. Marseille-Q2122]